jgi:hypothetical protein
MDGGRKGATKASVVHNLRDEMGLLTRLRMSFFIVSFSTSKMERQSTGRKLTCLAATGSQ